MALTQVAEHTSVRIRCMSSIGAQDVFLRANVWDQLQELSDNSTFIEPDYRAYIPTSVLRRCSPILKMALTVSKVCQETIADAIDAICVGTSLGCLHHTERFMQVFNTSDSPTISPTSFIQSTHNTIAGMLALLFNNQSYNMTYSQHSVSLEVSLIDALLLMGEGANNVLVCAADEKLDYLELLKPSVISSNLPFTSGATSMILQRSDSGREIIDCVVTTNQSKREVINNFLTKNGVSPSMIDVVLFSGDIPLEERCDLGEKWINYEQYTGLYYTSSAFAVHMAHDYPLNIGRYALVVNCQSSSVCGLTLIGV